MVPPAGKTKSGLNNSSNDITGDVVSAATPKLDNIER